MTPIVAGTVIGTLERRTWRFEIVTATGERWAVSIARGDMGMALDLVGRRVSAFGQLVAGELGDLPRVELRGAEAFYLRAA